MATEQELLRTILANPDDLAPRRELAALLESRKDPRGTFIRMQLRLHSPQRIDHGPNSVEARQVSAELEAKHVATWAKDVSGLVRGYQFIRGFVELVRMPARDFIDRAGELYDKAPIRHADLTDVVPVVDELASCKHLSRLVSLDVSGQQLGDAGVQSLVKSPHLGHLRWLGLRGVGAGRPALEAIAAAGLDKLLRVELADNPVADPRWRAGGVDWTGEILDFDVPDLARELEDQYGIQRWIRSGEEAPAREKL